MKISEIIARRRAAGVPVFSFEFFPPKTPKGEEALYRAIDELRPLDPDFVSVTYGAGGSTREKTAEWTSRIRSEHGVEAMAHLTCVGATKDELAAVVDDLAGRGVENILALRGDPPKGEGTFRPVAGGFAHADEMVSFIRSSWPGKFSIGVAGYPEKHPEAPDLENDVRRLAWKVAAGGDFVVTQLFFDNEAYFSFVDRLRRSADERVRSVPVAAGIMPITSKEQVGKFIAMCGASIPAGLARDIAGASDDAAAAEIGIAYAIRQVRELIDRGAEAIHFYTLNKSAATRRILASLRS